MTMTQPPAILSERAAASLRQSGLWARLFSIVLVLGFLLLLVFGAAMIVMALTARHHSDVAPFLIIGISSIVIGVVLIPVIIFAWLCASRAKAFDRSRQMALLDAALSVQKIYWLYTAIMSFLALLVVTTLLCIFVVLLLSEARY